MTFLRTVDPTILLIVSHAIAVGAGMTICSGLRLRAARHADQRWQAEMQRIDDVRLLSVRESMFGTSGDCDLSAVTTAQYDRDWLESIARAACPQRRLEVAAA
jgi:hypothetical protein